jgi:hypothetical protein
VQGVGGNRKVSSGAHGVPLGLLLQQSRTPTARGALADVLRPGSGACRTGRWWGQVCRLTTRGLTWSSSRTTQLRPQAAGTRSPSAWTASRSSTAETGIVVLRESPLKFTQSSRVTGPPACPGLGERLTSHERGSSRSVHARQPRLNAHSWACRRRKQVTDSLRPPEGCRRALSTLMIIQVPFAHAGPRRGKALLTTSRGHCL